MGTPGENRRDTLHASAAVSGPDSRDSAGKKDSDPDPGWVKLIKLKPVIGCLHPNSYIAEYRLVINKILNTNNLRHSQEGSTAIAITFFRQIEIKTLKPMKTRRSIILLTVLSIATSFSSVALQAKDTDGERPRHQWGKLLDRIELSDELSALVKQFRKDRAALMKQFRSLRSEHREAIAPLVADARSIDREKSPDEWEAAKQKIRNAKKAFRKEHGQGIRAARHDMRVLRRHFRHQIRDKSPPVDGKG